MAVARRAVRNLLLGVTMLVLLAPGDAQSVKQRPPPKRKAIATPTGETPRGPPGATGLARDVEELRRSVNVLNEMQGLLLICLRGTKTKDNKCLLLFATPQPYHAASEECFARGGQLALPSNADAAEELRDYASRALPGGAAVADDVPRWLWLGASDLREKGSFTDAEGSALSYAPWAAGTPPASRDGAAAGCVRGPLGQAGNWEAAPCKTQLPFVCQFNIPA